MNDLARQALRRVTAGLVAHGYTELVTAETRHRGTFGDLRQAVRDHLQHFVAQPVPIDVVDRLEVIEIENKQRAGFAGRQILGRSVEILDEAAAIGKARQDIVARHLMRFGLRLAPRNDLTAEVDGAPNRIDFGGYPKKYKKDNEPVDGVALRLVGERQKLVERVVPDRQQIKRQADRAHDDQVTHHAALPRVPLSETLDRRKRHARAPAGSRILNSRAVLNPA